MLSLTSDNAKVAAKIAARAGVDEFHADLLPQDKVTVLKTTPAEIRSRRHGRRRRERRPLSTTADIGIAMGAAGTDVAIETAEHGSHVR